MDKVTQKRGHHSLTNNLSNTAIEHVDSQQAKANNQAAFEQAAITRAGRSGVAW